MENWLVCQSQDGVPLQASRYQDYLPEVKLGLWHRELHPSTEIQAMTNYPNHGFDRKEGPQATHPLKHSLTHNSPTYNKAYPQGFRSDICCLTTS